MENYFVITKTRPGSVYFTLHPVSNTTQTRVIKLTPQLPSTRLPKDWALGVFLDANVFRLYEKGYFTFGNQTEEIKKAAVTEGVYFGNDLSNIKDNSNAEADCLKVLKGNSRQLLIDFIKKDRELVAMVARDHINELTQGTISTIEKELGIQLTVDEQ